MRGALAWIVMLIAGCAPDYGHTAFLCDDAHACPPDQMCLYGRCWRATPPDARSVACGAAGSGDAGLCTVGTQQCCVFESGTRCGDAGELCHGISALCDGPDDCPHGERCCADGTTVFCDQTCNHYACRVSDDCPQFMRCCPDQDTPWGVCSDLDC